MSRPYDTRASKLGFYWLYPFWVFVVGFLLLSIVPSYLSAGPRARTARAGAEMRYLSMALEAYREANNVYPPGRAYAGAVSVDHALTTPVAYLSVYPVQPPFAAANLRHGVRTWMARGTGAAIVIAALLWIVVVWRTVTTDRTRTLTSGVWLWIFGFLVAALPPLINPTLGESIPLLLLLGLACIPAVVWFWWVAWRWMTHGARPSWSVALLMLILPCLFQIGLTAQVVGSMLYQQQVDRLPESVREYQYATDGQTFYILQSTGPNGVHDLDLAAVIAEGTPALVTLTQPGVLDTYRYDPSNGIDSRGDILRVGP